MVTDKLPIMSTAALNNGRSKVWYSSKNHIQHQVILLFDRYHILVLVFQSCLHVVCLTFLSSPLHLE